MVALIVAIVLAGIAGYRIHANLAANKARAGKVSQGLAVAVETGPVARRDIIPVASFSANLEPLWSADIAAKVDGRIDRLPVDEGDKVRSGSLLATLDTNELAAQVAQAEGTLYSDKANLEQASLDLKRTQELAAQDAVSAQALDTARIKRDLAVGQVRAAQGNLDLLQARLNNANIVAPRDGIVTKRYIQAGSYTKAGSPIITLADMTSLLAKATVGEGEITGIVIGQPVNVKVSALGDKTFAGKITRISPAASLPARTFTVEITIPDPQNILKAGMFASVDIPGQVHKQALAVPESALVMREDQKTVYVVDDENKVRQKVLRLGYVGGGWAEVLDGVQEGERIVIAGQNKLRDGAPVSTGGGN